MTMSTVHHTRFVLAGDDAELHMWGGCECPEINHPEHGVGVPIVNGHCFQCGEPIHNADRCPCDRCQQTRRVEAEQNLADAEDGTRIDNDQLAEALEHWAQVIDAGAPPTDDDPNVWRSWHLRQAARYTGGSQPDREYKADHLRLARLFADLAWAEQGLPPADAAGIVLGSLWEDGKPPVRTKPTGGDLCMVQPDADEPAYGLLMRHKRHAVIGDYEVGKTHVLSTMALQCALEHVDMPICFLDFADDLEAIHWRLIDLGLDEQVANQITYATSLAEAEAQPADCLLLVDEFTGAITEAGLNQNAMSDIETIWRRLHGPDRTRTVVAADHRRKETENRRDFASGSSFKMAVVNGFAYFLENQAIAEPNLPMNIPLRLVKSKASPSLRTRGMRNPKKPGEIWIANLSIAIDPEGWATDQWTYRPMEALPATGRGNPAQQRERETRVDKLLTWSRFTSGEPATAAHAAKFLNVAKNTARKYLNELVEDGELYTEKGYRGAIEYYHASL